MFELLKRIYPLRLAPVSADADKTVQILLEELPFFVHKYPSLSEHNGWTVPYSWEVKKAEIRKNNKLIYNGLKHPLGVMGYAKSFKGKVSLSELKQHISFRKDLPDAIGYHCDYYYKPWRSDWGFSAPYTLFKKLKSGEYDIDLKTEYKKGTMKVLDYLLKGEKEDIIFLNAHDCHAAQANDDISGVVVAIEVMKTLKKRKKRKYSYKLIIAPEHLGTIFYLANTPDREVKKFKYGMFLEMLGNNNRFALQQSFNGDSLIDKAAHIYFKHNFPDYYSDKFRKIVGNDETVWESPGYEIPCISLSRAPYSQYHSNLDNEKIINEDKLKESVNTVLGIIDILETDTRMTRNFKGLMALSNPKYDLYIHTIDPSIRLTISKEQRKWNYLMDCVIRYFDGKQTISDIALKHDIDYFKLLDYLRKFEKKGLINFID
ncbi:MAG: DUF4910 domain-containing protein [Candidatus Omnitrophica bacterium]|nr:DUF4910 domain-containing protein [Candidatus Omnitrophota bacterium]MDD5352394.1 DUF4910 domain-containing protein [Candidatus Omnitrophota bacterium]MDD5549992.1 DUF4910 domain-containing protein [Candidatus Omnitrophota bacterium]